MISSIGMQIGIIRTLDRTVTEAATTVEIRNLQTGDQVYADELITTGLDGVVTIEFSDGDFHGGDFQVAVDINGDASYLLLDDSSLDSLIYDGVEQLT
tara:strand:+ start:179 stop:472 length:294 start_codon:yes stop_codon:yes gene_type:complete